MQPSFQGDKYLKGYVKYFNSVLSTNVLSSAFLFQFRAGVFLPVEVLLILSLFQMEKLSILDRVTIPMCSQELPLVLFRVD